MASLGEMWDGPCIQGALFAEEVIRGDHAVTNNIFRRGTIRLNVPGDTHYSPSYPWVYKECLNGSKRATIANDLAIYVDEVRTTAPGYDECRQVSRRVASLANYLGLQDAVRKRRDPSDAPGPWDHSPY